MPISGGPRKRGQKNRKQNRMTSGYTKDGTPRDWTSDVGSTPHKKYKKDWDKFVQSTQVSNFESKPPSGRGR